MIAPPPRFTSTLQLLALCPLLALGDMVVNAIGIGVCVLIVAPLSAVIVSTLRHWLDSATALAAALLVLSAGVAALELLMSAWWPELRASLGLFLPLLIANIVIADVASTAQQRRALLARSLAVGIGIALTLLPLGLARELVGRGSLFNAAGTLLGAWAEALQLHVFRIDLGFLLALLPPGAFFARDA